MLPSFNLLDEPWLPVRLKSGETVNLGLLDVFQRGSEAALLAETAPPSLVAEYRLLLAILHRALSRAFPQGWADKDRAHWYREGLPIEAICDYLEQWRDRFWLFHPEYPFMQVAALVSDSNAPDGRKPWMQISFDCSVGNTAVLFEHSYEGMTRIISPQYALSCLLGYLQFVPGGLVKAIRSSDKGGPLLNSAALIAEGDHLLRTLILNLHPSMGSKSGGDLPAWERESPTLSSLSGPSTLATGPNDRYTRQTRAVLLLRENDGQVKWLKFAAGLALDEDANAPDPMVSFRQGSQGPVRLTFSEGRAVWRDLPVLVPHKESDNSAPAVLDWALSVHTENGEDITTIYQRFSVAGLSSDQAKIVRWRNERIELPLSIIRDCDKHPMLNGLIGASENLYGRLRELATGMIAEMMSDSSHKDTRSRARQVLNAGPFTGSYFARIERRAPELMQFLARREFDDAEIYWSEVLRSSAMQAWKQLTLSMGLSSLALRSQVRFEPRFYRILKEFAPNPNSTTEVNS